MAVSGNYGGYGGYGGNMKQEQAVLDGGSMRPEQRVQGTVQGILGVMSPAHPPQPQPFASPMLGPGTPSLGPSSFNSRNRQSPDASQKLAAHIKILQVPYNQMGPYLDLEGFLSCKETLDLSIQQLKQIEGVITKPYLDDKDQKLIRQLSDTKEAFKGLLILVESEPIHEGLQRFVNIFNETADFLIAHEESRIPQAQQLRPADLVFFQNGQSSPGANASFSALPMPAQADPMGRGKGPIDQQLHQRQFSQGAQDGQCTRVADAFASTSAMPAQADPMGRGKGPIDQQHQRQFPREEQVGQYARVADAFASTSAMPAQADPMGRGKGPIDQQHQKFPIEEQVGQWGPGANAFFSAPPMPAQASPREDGVVSRDQQPLPEPSPLSVVGSYEGREGAKVRMALSIRNIAYIPRGEERIHVAVSAAYTIKEDPKDPNTCIVYITYTVGKGEVVQGSGFDSQESGRIGGFDVFMRGNPPSGVAAENSSPRRSRRSRGRGRRTSEANHRLNWRNWSSWSNWSNRSDCSNRIHGAY